MDLKRLSGSTRSFSVEINDGSIRWAETPAGESMDLVSTSGLLKLIHGCSSSLLEPYLSHDFLAVVVRASITHLVPLKMGEEVVIEMEVKCPKDDCFVFSGEVRYQGKQCALFTTERRITTIEELGRKLSEES